MTVKNAPTPTPVQVMSMEVKSSAPLYNSFDKRKLQVKKIVRLGGLSDLFFDAEASDEANEIYWAITDRGPNGESKDRDGDGFEERIFPVAEFSPQILKLQRNLASKEVQLLESIVIKNPKGRGTSGLPNVNPKLHTSNADEIPVDSNLKALGFDPWGLDPEGLVRAKDGSFWVSEEYGPSLLHLDAKGKIIERWVPMASESPNEKPPENFNQRPQTASKNPRGGLANLPEILGLRKSNRGFEALTFTKNGTLLAFLQSELTLDNHKGYSFILEFSPSSKEAIGLYLYPLSPEGGKIGAATLTHSGEIAVLEHNSKLGSKAWQKIFTIDFSVAKNWLGEPLAVVQSLPKPIVAVTKSLKASLDTSSLNRFEKLEGLTQNSLGEWVLANDNDFMESLIENRTIEIVNSEADTKSYIHFVPGDTRKP